MAYRSPAFFMLRLLVVTLALAIGAAGLFASWRIEQAPRENLHLRAEHEARRNTTLLMGWLDTRRQALRGMAALFLSSDSVSAAEFQRAAEVMQSAADEDSRMPIAYLQENDSQQLRVVHRAGTPLPGFNPDRTPGLTWLLRYAVPGNRGTYLSPPFRNADGGWRAYHAYPLLRQGRRALVLTVIDFNDMFRTLSTDHLQLRLALAPLGSPPVFLRGTATPFPGSRFTIPMSMHRASSTWYWYWDVLPMQSGTARYTQWLSAAIRYGGLVLALALGAAALILLELYRRSYQREQELKSARDLLMESETHYRTLVDQMPGAVFRCQIDRTWHMIYLSPAIEMLTGLPPAALVDNRQQRFSDLIHPDDRDQVRRRIQHALIGDETYELEYRLLRPDGQLRWVYERGRTTQLGSQRAIDGVLLDISARKEAEAARENALRALRAIIDNTPNVAIQGYDTEGRVLFWNHASEKLFGWNEAEAVGRRAADFMFSEVDHHNFVGVLHHIAATGEATEPTEWPVTRRDGRIAWTLSTQFAIDLENGRTGFVCMDVDITVRKQYEDELRLARDRLEEAVAERTRALQAANEELRQAMNQLVQSEKLASLGSLVAGIAHELNTPLGNTVTVSSTLKEKVAEFRTRLDGDRLKRSDLASFVDTCGEAAALIEKGAQRASELISNFKQVAVDTASTRRRDFDLKQTVTEVLSTLRPQFKHTPHRVVLDLPEGIRLQSYPGPLEQVLTNLVTNSLTHGFAASEAGVIRIHAGRIDERELHLIYEDNGCGIPQTLRSRVFDPFFTTRLGQGGSGLGLYIVYNLVHRILGGRLELDEAAQGGVRFTLILPRNAPQPQEHTTHEFHS
ncbi:PAS domain S-box protein [Chitiniphilus purpureus]|uniref:histidine kinase n=1 Tax=Chitiniphilus purpureus TaxID=2981137 RepID=A0ABY6DUM4_9NEIS|nr:PAS domain-containing sensor histidine kinase [Chitiniphilus sp. CD1]UXY16761.1 PAS domain S-box protein [Chitiniphilus sp. CD1]